MAWQNQYGGEHDMASHYSRVLHELKCRGTLPPNC
jgi:hypothetical protein